MITQPRDKKSFSSSHTTPGVPILQEIVHTLKEKSQIKMIFTDSEKNKQEQIGSSQRLYMTKSDHTIARELDFGRNR